MFSHPLPKNSPELDGPATHGTPDPDIKKDAPFFNEIRLAMKKLKNGRAPSPDNIPAELFKCAIELVNKALHKLFCKVWGSAMIPSE